MKQKIYVFGNVDYHPDSKAVLMVKKLHSIFPNIDFITIKPNQDLPFINEDRVFMIDNILGIDEIILVNEKNIDEIKLPPRFSAHDFDLGFQLKYLIKLGKIKKFKIIGLPIGKEIKTSKIINLIKELM